MISLALDTRCSIQDWRSIMNCSLGFGWLVLFASLIALDSFLYFWDVDVVFPVPVNVCLQTL